MLRAKDKKYTDTFESGSRFGISDRGRRLLGGIAAVQPKVSSLAWSNIIPFVLKAYLDEVDLGVDIEQL